MLRRIFGPKAEEVKGAWRKFRNEELSFLSRYYEGDQVMEDGGGQGQRGSRDVQTPFVRDA